MVESGKLSAGHARAVAGLSDEEALTVAEEIVSAGLSVRQTEQRVRTQRDASASKPAKLARTPLPKQNAAVQQLENELRHRLQTDVQIELSGAERGTLKISFYSADDLERLTGMILPDHRYETGE